MSASLPDGMRIGLLSESGQRKDAEEGDCMEGCRGTLGLAGLRTVRLSTPAAEEKMVGQFEKDLIAKGLKGEKV